MGSYASYLKAALLSQINLVVLAGVGLVSLVSMNPLPIFIGLAGEAVWVIGAPLVPAFRTFADKRTEKFHKIDQESELKRIVDMLPTKERQRYAALSDVTLNVQGDFARYSDSSRVFLQSLSKRFDDMMLRYAKMLNTKAVYDAYMVNISPEELQQKIESLRAEEAAMDERVGELKKQQREIVEKRLVRFAKAQKDLVLLNTQIDTFEDMVKLLKDQAVSMKDSSEITGQLDILMSDIELTEQTVSELEGSFSALFDRQLREAEQKQIES